MIELLEKLFEEMDKDSFEFKEVDSPSRSTIQYDALKNNEKAGTYVIEPRRTSVHIIAASIDEEFRGQGATEQFIDLVLDKYNPNYLTTTSQLSAVGFWKKMGFREIRKGEGGGVYMLKWV